MQQRNVRTRLPRSSRSRGVGVGVVITLLLLLLQMVPYVPATAAVGDGLGEPLGHRAFSRVWAWTDQPVATQQASRTWMWGPGAASGLRWEPYAEAQDGQRLVQYFDKSRMEINDPGADEQSPWFVTNGLLATELITGRLQVADSAYELHPAAQVNVAGDPDDAGGPTYATFATLLESRRLTAATPIITRVARDGTLTTAAHLAQWGARDAEWVVETQHFVAEPFWTFMTSAGRVYADGVYSEGALFPSPFYATGYPITDAWWASVRVGGTERDVLVQCFERRCLTYTPLNAPEWRVEAGNIGLHYLLWRDTQVGKAPVPAEIRSGPVTITQLVAIPDAVGHEYVDLRNDAPTALHLEGWTLHDAAGTTYTFPDVVFAPNATLRLHVAHGQNTSTDLYWGRSGSVWNNGHDTATLRDASGAVIATFFY